MILVRLVIAVLFGMHTVGVDADESSSVLRNKTTRTQPSTSRTVDLVQRPSFPMKIMVLSDPNPITYISGQSMRFRTLLEHIVHNHPDDTVHLVTCEKNDANPPTSCYDGKIPIDYTQGFRLPQYKALSVSFDWTGRVWKLTGKHRYDVIHVSSPGGLVVPAILASHFRGIPLVMSYHTHVPAYMRSYMGFPWNIFLEWITWKIIEFTHFWADLTVVTSPQMKDALHEHGVRSVIWPKGVNSTQFHPRFRNEEMRSRMMGGKSDALLLVYIGRLAKEKRLTYLKPILEKLQDRNIPVHLCMVGDGPETEALIDYFRGTPTTFLGSLTGIPLSEASASGDIFVMPSDSETLGFVVMESMASGVPVVASKCGGLIDLIRDGETGFLVTDDLNSTDSFVTKIEALYHDQHLRTTMSQSGRALAEEWSWEASMSYLRESAYSEAKVSFLNRFSQRTSRWFRAMITGTPFPNLKNRET